MKLRSGALMLAAAVSASCAAFPAAAHGWHRAYGSRIHVVHIRKARPAYVVSARSRVDPYAVVASTYTPPLGVKCAYPIYGEPYPPSAFLADCTEYTPPPGRALVLRQAVDWNGVHYFAQFPARTEAGFYPKPIRIQLRKVRRHVVVLHARY